MALDGRKKAREGGQRLPLVGDQDFYNCFLLQLLDPIASIFDYLYSIHKRRANFERKAFTESWLAHHLKVQSWYGAETRLIMNTLDYHWQYRPSQHLPRLMYSTLHRIMEVRSKNSAHRVSIRQHHIFIRVGTHLDLKCGLLSFSNPGRKDSSHLQRKATCQHRKYSLKPAFT